MYNGEYFDPRQLIGEITVNSTLRQRRLRYATSPHYDTMGIRVTGSPAFGDFGFIAEIVTLPQSPSGRPDFGNVTPLRCSSNSSSRDGYFDSDNENDFYLHSCGQKGG